MSSDSIEDSRSEVFRGLPFSDYLALPNYGSGAFSEIRVSPKTFHWYQVLKNKKEETDAMAFGRIAHLAVLEPKEFADKFVVLPKFDRRTNAGKADFKTFMEAVPPDALVVPEEDSKTLVGMLDALRNHKRASDLLRRGEAEISVTSELEGVPVKGRFDFLVMDKDKDGKPQGLFCIDLKTVKDARPRAFQRQMIERGWWIQAGLYTLLAERAFGIPCIFVFLAIEKKAPFEIGVYCADQSVIECGRKAVGDGIDKIKECLASGVWPGVCEDFTNVSMPDYLLNELSVESEE